MKTKETIMTRIELLETEKRSYTNVDGIFIPEFADRIKAINIKIMTLMEVISWL